MVRILLFPLANESSAATILWPTGPTARCSLLADLTLLFSMSVHFSLPSRFVKYFQAMARSVILLLVAAGYPECTCMLADVGVTWGRKLYLHQCKQAGSGSLAGKG